MTKQSFFSFCLSDFRVSPDYPFDEDFETAVLRHWDNRKWFAIVMQVSRRKFGFDSDETVEVVNLKLPVEMFGSFGKAEGVYPAYHMNKRHWLSVILDRAEREDVEFLLNTSSIGSRFCCPMRRTTWFAFSRLSATRQPKAKVRSAANRNESGSRQPHRFSGTKNHRNLSRLRWFFVSRN